MANMRISDIPAAASLHDGDIFEIAQVDSGSTSGYMSFRTTLILIANYVAKLAQYTSDLQTTDKTLIGAINELKRLISLIPQFSIDVVQTLPTEDISDTTIYLVPAQDPESGNYYEEYIHVNDAWELVGTTAVDLSAYYTKLEVDAKFSELATVATSGSYNDLLNKPTLDVNETILKNPYTKKVVPSGKYTEKLKKIIGATVNWNQLVEVRGTDISKTENGVTYTDNRDGSYTISTASGGATADTILSIIIGTGLPIIGGHVYLKSGANIQKGVQIVDTYIGWNLETKDAGLFTRSGASYTRFQIKVASGTIITTPVIVYPMFTDLTAMFGSTIAERAYTLEQAEAGSGIAWLQSYGFFLDAYNAYDAGSLQSVSVSAKINKDSNDQIISSKALDHTDLNGLFKLDANNNLYADGDEYLPNGSENVNFDKRAYQAGDESLTDAITDGTNTVVKLTTPTTATLTPYEKLQPIEQGGTEEFVDYGVQSGTRDVAIPAGNETAYGDNENMGKIINYMTT